MYESAKNKGKGKNHLKVGLCKGEIKQDKDATTTVWLNQGGCDKINVASPI